MIRREREHWKDVPRTIWNGMASTRGLARYMQTHNWKLDILSLNMATDVTARLGFPGPSWLPKDHVTLFSMHPKPHGRARKGRVFGNERVWDVIFSAVNIEIHLSTPRMEMRERRCTHTCL